MALLLPPATVTSVFAETCAIYFYSAGTKPENIGTSLAKREGTSWGRARWQEINFRPAAVIHPPARAMGCRSGNCADATAMSAANLPN